MRQIRQLPRLVVFGVWAARSEGPSWRGRCQNTGSPGARSAEWSISSHAACSHCGACSGLKSSKQSNFDISVSLRDKGATASSFNSEKNVMSEGWDEASDLS